MDLAKNISPDSSEWLLSLGQALSDILDITAPLLRKMFERSAQFELKNDSSPVTKTDLEIEGIIKTEIKKLFEQAIILGEETKSEFNSTKDKLLFCIDPIDGTKSFITGLPIFCSLIGVYCNDKPLLGVIDTPCLRERLIGFKKSCYILDNSSQLSLYEKTKSSAQVLANSTLAATTPEMFEGLKQGQFERLKRQVAICRFGGDAYNYGLLAQDRLDLVIEADLQFYDIAALVPIIEASGGIITDWSGRRLRIQPDKKIAVLAASNASLHAQALKILKG